MFAWLFLAAVATAQAPSPKPFGNLAQLMRSLLFPASNLIFDTQTQDPGAVRKIGETGNGGATASLAGLYTGWQVVEDSAVALEESADLIMRRGRFCENGNPVPVKRADWVKFTQALRQAARAAYQASRSRDLEKMSGVTDELSEACLNCHDVYLKELLGKGNRATCLP